MRGHCASRDNLNKMERLGILTYRLLTQGLYLGIISGWAGPVKSPTQKLAAQARPGLTVGPHFPVQTRSVGPKNGRAVGPSLQKNTQTFILGPAQVSCRCKICSLGPARLHVLARRVGPFLGRAGRAGLPMPRLARGTLCRVGHARSIWRPFSSFLP
jgi:hypothetical protein